MSQQVELNEGGGPDRLGVDLERRQLLGSLTFAGLAALAVQSRGWSATLDAGGAEPGVSSALRTTLAILSETILPRTTTPGAIDADVPRYIEFVIHRGLDAPAREAFLAGAEAFRADARGALGVDFNSSDGERRGAYVAALDRECFAGDAAGGERVLAGVTKDQRAAVLAFLLAVKRLVVIGYYTSDAGAHSELDVELMPGLFRGAVPTTQTTRTYYEDSFGVPVERPPGYLSRS